ncbi:MAG: HAMP domain-containing histidine kinase, partial [Motiliproteus sp.]|nr:HAMP domain-containing histidine kinase [Motiliproteus sp.]
HEINTPVGTSLTSASLISDLTTEFKQQMEKGTLTQSSAESFSRDFNEASDLINTNLKRASSLISSFKQIAVDQTNEQSAAFNVLRNLQATVGMLDKEIKQCPCEVAINCDPELTIVSYQNSFSQVFTNLINNSILHGFKNSDSGLISIDIEQRQQMLYISYRDDGRGIPEQIRHRIFNPFVTSSRSGGSGLGTHLIYNLVTQLLKGTIACNSDGETGAQFEIQIPLNLQSQPDDEADDMW